MLQELYANRQYEACFEILLISSLLHDQPSVVSLNDDEVDLKSC